LKYFKNYSPRHSVYGLLPTLSIAELERNSKCDDLLSESAIDIFLEFIDVKKLIKDIWTFQRFFSCKINEAHHSSMDIVESSEGPSYAEKSPRKRSLFEISMTPPTSYIATFHASSSDAYDSRKRRATPFRSRDEILHEAAKLGAKGG
jgi:hypothetical protein